jgi:hypothetical protein
LFEIPEKSSFQSFPPAPQRAEAGAPARKDQNLYESTLRENEYYEEIPHITLEILSLP